MQGSLNFDLLQDNLLVVASFICCRGVRSVELLVLSAWIWSAEAVVLSSHCRVSLYLDVPSCLVCEHPTSMHAAYVRPIQSQHADCSSFSAHISPAFSWKVGHG